MNITLYKTSSPPNKLDKALNSAISMTGTLRDETNVMTPSIIVNAGNISDYNYCVISDFHRSYFITSIDSVRNGVWRINLKCDVLTTYKSEIRQLNAIISKQEKDNKNTNKMYNDGTYKSTPETFSQVINFPETLSTGIPVYLLTCI